jgi:hypothetical protein
MPLSREQVQRRRAHEALERGGTLPEGGDRPSSEAEPHPRERPALERGGTPLEGVPSPPSKAEVCPCGVAPLERSGVLLEGGWVVYLVGRQGHQGSGPSRWTENFVLSVFWVRLRFVFSKESGFSLVV